MGRQWRVATFADKETGEGQRSIERPRREKKGERECRMGVQTGRVRKWKKAGENEGSEGVKLREEGRQGVGSREWEGRRKCYSTWSLELWSKP